MHYCQNELIINDVLRFFGGIYYIRDMADDKKKELYEKIKNSPNEFILKPMKEGGGNNVSGENLKNIIPEGDNEPNDLLKNSIIVEKIKSNSHESMILKNEKINVQNSISEFSIYGIILTNEKNLYINKSVSFLVRTKNKDDLEGGVMEGAGAIDIPYLVDVKLESNLSKKVEVTAEEIQKYLDDLKAAEEAKKKAEEEEAKKKAEEEEAKKKEEEEAKKKAEEEAKNNEGDGNKSEEKKSE